MTVPKKNYFWDVKNNKERKDSITFFLVHVLADEFD